ncbi:uncharacterized protein OCT59_005179 [Rhizophagus irregularis]|uniref:uncharacterized protein n=1 Tax=Rhizophagus irregularis TaxID=588596 RepID=UPI00332108B9|nr:hypothetical protein OCT59_005179 [Rhizophagus irregularis]
MPKTRGNFWSEYEVTVDSNGKEKYTCKTCSGTWSKNASRLKEHIEKCKDINVETETSQPQGTKRKRQQTFDEYKFAFTSKDQIILESLLIRAFTQREERHTSENIALGLETTMKDADINKFGAIITDNAPNMKAA